MFLGLAPAVLAIVVQAVLRIGGRALRNRALVGLAVAAFLALAVFGLPFPLVVLGAGVVGWGLGRWRPGLLAVAERPEPEGATPPLISDDALHHARPSVRRNLGILVAGLLVWVAPVVAVWLLVGRTRSTSTRACSSAGWLWSPSAAPTRCSPTSPRPRSRPTAGCPPARWCAGSPWPRPRPAR